MQDNFHFSVSSIEADDHVEIDADSLASSLHKSMSKNFALSKKCCIFRIPNVLRRHNPTAFVPNAFSIGPWHHGQGEHLKQAEEIKLNYLRRLISRWPSPETKLKELIQAIGKIEDVRAYYAEPIEMSVDDFVMLLVIDGCFIIELFRRNYYENWIPTYFNDEYDPMFYISFMNQNLYHDLILLENQIPWSVLKLLFDETKEPGSLSLEQLGIMFFGNKFSMTVPPLLNSYHGKLHVLDLLREWLVSGPYIAEKVAFRDKGELEWQLMPSAQRLKEARIKFKKCETRSILDVRFVGGVLEVPSLLIHETTEVVFRNLISFEQCCTECPASITSYAVLLDDLLNTKKDLEILCEEGISKSRLNPEDATQFFHDLYQDTYLEEYCYLDLCVEVNTYRSFPWPRLRAWYLHNFVTPWAIVS